MSLYIDKKYVALISSKLDQYKQKSEFLWNFRCPLCGDSKKNKYKARGYIYRTKSDLFYSCHNCGMSLPFVKFLKSVDLPMYNQYRLEKFQNKATSNAPASKMVSTKPVFNVSKRWNVLSIESLPDTHSAKKFLLKRKIPTSELKNLFYTDDFASFVKDSLGVDKELKKNDPRIIIPFNDGNGHLLGVQGRALVDSNVKYITIKINDDVPKIYGLNRVFLDKPLYVVEGPFDSMFLPNCLAMMESDLYSVFSIIGHDKDCVLVFDNEPRNPQIVNQMEKAIKANKKICIWPNNIDQKDVNDMFLAGLEPRSIIDSNTFSGPMAVLRFNSWKKF